MCKKQLRNTNQLINPFLQSNHAFRELMIRTICVCVCVSVCNILCMQTCMREVCFVKQEKRYYQLRVCTGYFSKVHKHVCDKTCAIQCTHKGYEKRNKREVWQLHINTRIERTNCHQSIHF